MDRYEDEPSESLQLWRQLEQLARAADRRLFAALIESSLGRAPKPLPEDFRLAAHARRLADAQYRRWRKEKDQQLAKLIT